MSSAGMPPIIEIKRAREKNMSKHTPEPWGKAGHGNYGYMNEADGDRAVACVNALAGKNPEAVGELVEASQVIRDKEPCITWTHINRLMRALANLEAKE